MITLRPSLQSCRCEHWPSCTAPPAQRRAICCSNSGHRRGFIGAERQQLTQICSRGRHSCRAAPEGTGLTSISDRQQAEQLVGEDAAHFDVQQQSTGKWVFFTVELAVVLGIMYVVWIAPSTGVASAFLEQLEKISSDSTALMLAIFAVFALVHSGLAYLRPYGEDLIGARAFRVIFAAISLPLATLALVHFINHRYDGLPLWNLRGQPFVHETVWILNFISFFFLYPSTFNLLEVAAVDEPKLHMWETGVMRITRHPQSFGQALWCFAHTLWIGSSFMVATSGALMAHHLFSCWHGDYRLRRKYGEAFDAVKERTSIVPFQAIWEGRQKLPKAYYKEWLRLPYATILAVTLGTYWAHPLMQSASHWLDW
ncbi:hypothetical protein CVIRNUC_009850 [Coccomyxa viridis]|uniref:NnrU domain-containing protein n=1 Tax=Coccomyxa viridis TaxID=1274662 RepID=A0AAV1IJ06_9CHLO|nr:hypothetical protein CVIRNUC_009850 [Coccomyxa viridis]